MMSVAMCLRHEFGGVHFAFFTTKLYTPVVVTPARVMVIFTRQVPARVKVRRLVLLFTVHWARDFTTGATTTLLMSVRSMLMILSSALVAREVFVANTGVVND